MRSTSPIVLAVIGCTTALCWPPSPTQAASQPGKLSFTDITLSAGVGGSAAPGRTGGHGAMFADVDDDGRPDLYVTMVFKRPMAELFFRNIDGSRFREEGKARGIADHDGGSHGACFADLDSDGDYDLFNGATWSPPKFPAVNNIFRNDGTGRFTDVTIRSGIPMDRTWPTRAVLAFDMDRDGDLDLFCVTNYQGSKDPPNERNEVYRNEGNMRFAAVTSGALVTAPCGQGAIDTDWDGDGDVDVIAANRTGEVNILRNEGGGRFASVTPAAIGIRHRAADGISAADVDGDGDLDMLLASDDAGHLYLNDGRGTFIFAQSFSDTDGYMGGFADLDNDGDVDIVFAGDDVCYLNDGRGAFRAGPSVPVSGINDPRGIAFADLDNDGDLDFAIGCKRSRNWLVRNDLNSGNWLKVRLISPQSQAGAFGAKTRVYPAKQSPNKLLGLRESRSNNGYLGQDDPVLHFGLGAHQSVDVVVTFLDGTEVTQTNVAAKQTVTIRGTKASAPSAPAEDRGGLTLDRAGTEWTPFLEWTIENPTFAGNPYDLIARATFVHAGSGEKRTTGMFYDGGRAWKFRFTATRSGVWTFTTSSTDPDLDGTRGKVSISPNPGVPGFVTSFGSKWGRTGTNRAFVPQLVMYANPPAYYNNPGKIDADLQTFIVEHGFNGLHTSVRCRWFDIDKERSNEISEPDPNPDPRTFEALELLITKVHAAGGMVHIWAWGDESRRQTPIRWGKNGAVDRRLQRYIAARLGPLPGWTMGYGFDLDEWTREEDLREWHTYMHKHLGWLHLLGGRSVGPNRYQPGAEFPQIYQGLDYSGYEQHRPTYEAYVAAIQARPTKPSFSEDRFRVREPSPYPKKDYDEERTRRGLWHSTMAGGVANIWGYLPRRHSSSNGSASYPRPEWIKTYAVFFKNRFLKDMVRDNTITDGVCLKDPGHSHYVFYKEDTASIRMDLAAMTGDRNAIAVDAKRPYREIALGQFGAKEHDWAAPYESDWAVAVGDFTAQQR